MYLYNTKSSGDSHLYIQTKLPSFTGIIRFYFEGGGKMRCRLGLILCHKVNLLFKFSSKKKSLTDNFVMQGKGSTLRFFFSLVGNVTKYFFLFFSFYLLLGLTYYRQGYREMTGSKNTTTPRQTSMFFPFLNEEIRFI